MKEMVKYSFILGVICLLSSSILAVVNAVTGPRIMLQKQQEEAAALKAVLPAAEAFKQDKEDEFVYYSGYDKNNKLAGFVVKCGGKGYSSFIEVLAGLNTSLEITDIKILSQNETPGLGNKITGADFQSRFKGKDPDSVAGVDAIAGATISSRAVINSIKETLLVLKPRLTKEAKDAK